MHNPGYQRYSTSNDFSLPSWFKTPKYSSIATWLVARIEKRIVACYFNRQLIDDCRDPLKLFNEYDKIWKNLDEEEKHNLINKSVDELDHFKKESYINFATDGYYIRDSKGFYKKRTEETSRIIREFNWNEIMLKLILGFNEISCEDDTEDFIRLKCDIKKTVTENANNTKGNFLLCCLCPNLTEGLKIEKYFMNLMIKYIHDLYIEKNINDLIIESKNNEKKKSKNSKKKNKKRGKNSKKNKNKLKNETEENEILPINKKCEDLINQNENKTNLEKIKNERAESACKKISKLMEDKKNNIIKNNNHSVNNNKNIISETGSDYLYESIKTTGLEDFWEDSKKISFEADSFFDEKTQKQSFSTFKGKSDTEKLSKDFVSFGKRSFSGRNKTILKSEYKSDKSRKQFFYNNNDNNNECIKENENLNIKQFNEDKNPNNKFDVIKEKEKQRKCLSLIKIEEKKKEIIFEMKKENEAEIKKDNLDNFKNNNNTYKYNENNKSNQNEFGNKINKKFYNNKNNNNHKNVYKYKLKRSNKDKYNKKDSIKFQNSNKKNIKQLDKRKVIPKPITKENDSSKKKEIVKKIERWVEVKEKSKNKENKEKTENNKKEENKNKNKNKTNKLKRKLKNKNSQEKKQKKIIEKWDNEDSKPLIFNSNKQKKKTSSKYSF